MIAHRLRRTGWNLTLLAVAIVFNPLFPMPFPQQLWMAVDAIVGLVLLVSSTLPKHTDDLRPAPGA